MLFIIIAMGITILLEYYLIHLLQTEKKDIKKMYNLKFKILDLDRCRSEHIINESIYYEQIATIKKELEELEDKYCD